MLDVALIGSGPAALTAAIYLTRAGFTAKVFERGRMGGALNETARIVNYPGFEGEGPELAEKFRDQAVEFGAKLEYGECSKIEAVEADNRRHFQLTIDDEVVSARAALVATGSEPKQLSFVPAAPVSYCSLCDAGFAAGKHIAVIGGGNSAVQEAIYLSQIVSDLTLISHSLLKASQALQQHLRQLSNVTIRENLEPTPELLQEFEYIFVFIGKRPATHFLPSEILASDGYIQTGGEARRGHETAIPGLFAAGDVRQHTVKQVVTAAGDGAAAAIELIQYLQALGNGK